MFLREVLSFRFFQSCETEIRKSAAGESPLSGRTVRSSQSGLSRFKKAGGAFQLTVDGKIYLGALARPSASSNDVFVNVLHVDTFASCTRCVNVLNMLHWK